MKIPHDAERLMNELPQDVLNEIQLEMVIFSGLSLIEMGPSEPSKKQIKKHMKRSMKEHIKLLRAAKVELDKAGRCLMEIYPDHIPSEIQALESFLIWKNISKEDGKMTKSPVSSAGIGIAHNNTDELMPFELAKERLSKASGLGLGISLLEGVKVNVEAHTGYLWCLDFDGFREPNSNKVDDGVLSFVESFPSYTEISPSGTGFKYFFVCDRPPQSKSKIKFGPSEFC